MATRNKFSPEVCERAVRMVEEHRADYGSEWAAMTSIAAKTWRSHGNRKRMAALSLPWPDIIFGTAIALIALRPAGTKPSSPSAPASNA
jgi:hypothetical protein